MDPVTAEIVARYKSWHEQAKQAQGKTPPTKGK